MAVFFKNDRIAGYIRAGIRFRVNETTKCWLDYDGDIYHACALGLAIAGKLGVWRGHQTFLTKLAANEGDEIKTISEILGIDPRLVEEINKLHNLDVPAEEIAECLEFEHGDDEDDSAYS